jgi:hypothetical protein
MKQLFAAIVCVGLIVLAVPAYGQQQAGDLELQFMGYYLRSVGTSYDFSMGTIQAKIGPYVTDHLQVGVGPTLSITTAGGSTTTTFGSTAFLVYSFLTRGGKVVPYFGAQYYKQDFSADFTEDPGNVGVNLGMKYFFGKKTALDVSANYLFDLRKEAEGGTLFFAVGLSFLI